MIAWTQSESGLVLTINRKGLKNEAAGADVIHSHELLRLQRPPAYTAVAVLETCSVRTFTYGFINSFNVISLYNISCMKTK